MQSFTTSSSNFYPAIAFSSSSLRSPLLDLLIHQLYQDLGVVLSPRALMTWFIPAADPQPVEGEVSADSEADRSLLHYRYSCCTRFVYGDVLSGVEPYRL